ncbi:response regulator [Vibrio nitrifigilis]|uniref:Response regulator n=1 Tax=Vibrio nitrifigilis TaxID=2789781 RepID=A0ABS0GD96_9VIBR|nr:response regulator [Vibrio nitrifigilis]MBF9000325.1 response regulator [Vibrio nitrifigilis]
MYNIVIVEDEPIELESLHRIIAQCVDNAVLHEASTGKRAIELIDELKHIDMMFIDINIPLPNGKEVIEYLKAKNTETKVVVTTANDDFDILHSMITLRVEDYLLKPVKKTTLTDTIKRTLGIDEQTTSASSALKTEVLSLLQNDDCTQWHNFLLQHINHAYEQTLAGTEARRNVTELLEILNTYLKSLGHQYASVCSILDELIHEVERHGLTQALYSHLTLSLLKLSHDIFAVSGNTVGNKDFIQRAKLHIERHILSDLSLDDIASHAYVSSCYLSRAFKKKQQIGLSNYVAQRKLHIACGLLQFSDLKINAIALELAWQDANYFCRIFKKEQGIAPSDYRLMHAPRRH